jgi:RNA exonuclease 1
MQIPSQDINLSTDCEMCVTVEGKALTRVCVIDYATNQVVYNQFIKPPSPITDYLTRFSDIMAQALESVTKTLAVQAHLRTLITPSTILFRLLTESDLRALQLSHPRCIDNRLDLPLPTRAPAKAGSSAYARVARSYNTGSWAWRTRSRRGCASLC